MTTSESTTLAGRIGILWRCDPRVDPSAGEKILKPIFNAFAELNVAAEPVVYTEEVAASVREQLLRLDGVLVWVDPIVRGRERGALDELLRDVAERGVFVSAHPGVIEKMGAKDVLYRTRDMPWGTDTQLYRNMGELRGNLPPLLRSGATRVLKQNRGSGGNGVWKIKLVTDASPVEDALVRVQHAQRGGIIEELRLGDFLDRCERYFQTFGGAGAIVDQPYAERLGEGMIRCYLIHDRVAGFGHHYVTALMPPPPGEKGPPDPPARVYYGPAKPEFQRIKALLEGGWLRQMQELLGVESEQLPVVWDADFLLGPKTAAGDDTFVLCEINVSGVYPIPEETIVPLARAATARVLEAKAARRAS